MVFMSSRQRLIHSRRRYCLQVALITRMLIFFSLTICADGQAPTRPTAVFQTGHAGPVMCLDTNFVAKLAASVGPDGSISIWQAATGMRLRTIPTQGGPVIALRFSPDGKQLASLTLFETRVTIW